MNLLTRPEKFSLYRALGEVERMNAQGALKYLARITVTSWDLQSARTILQVVVAQGSWTPGRMMTARVDLKRVIGLGPEDVCVYVGTPRDCYRKAGWEAGKRHWRHLVDEVIRR